MFNYGIIGALLIIFTAILLLFEIYPLAYWYAPISWMGFILFFDYLVSEKSGSSLLHNKSLTLYTFLLSIELWLILDLYNFLVFPAWYYQNLPNPQFFYYLLSISAILPSIIESIEFSNLYFPVKIKMKKFKFRIPRKIAFSLLLLSMCFFFISLIFKQLLQYTIPFVVIGMLLFSDSSNFLLKKQSFIGDLSNGNLTRLISSLIGGYVVCVYWEILNSLLTTWVYTPIIPFLTFSLLRVPLHVWIGSSIGYLGFYSTFLLFRNLIKK
jgi:hypothetical protein